MDSKLDSNKDEKSNVTENDASKAKTSRIKLFVGVIAVAVAITTAIASALVNRPQRDDVVILTPPAAALRLTRWTIQAVKRSLARLQRHTPPEKQRHQKPSQAVLLKPKKNTVFLLT